MSEELKLVHLAREVLGLKNSADPMPSYTLADLARDMADANWRRPLPVEAGQYDEGTAIVRLQARALAFVVAEIRACPAVLQHIRGAAAVLRRKAS